MSVSKAVEAGDRRSALLALRANLAARLDACTDREAAAIAKTLAQIVQEIDGIPDTTRELSAVESITAKRQTRRKSAAKA
jgi:hypothetical protein